MQWLDEISRDISWLAVLVSLVAAGVLGAAMPRLIARLPEPEAEPEPAPGAESSRTALPPAPPKVPYTELAARPGLGRRNALWSALVGALVAVGVGWTWALLPLLLFVPVGVALAYVDWHTTLLPTRLIAPSYVAIVVLLLAVAALSQDTGLLIGAALGWLVWGGLFVVLWFVYPAGMGYGDVRLSGLLGLLLGQLGWPEVLVGLYGSFLVGGVLGVLLSRLQVVDRKRFPFGPFMLIGALAGLLLGDLTAGGLGY